MSKKTIKILLPVLILVLAIGVARYLTATRAVISPEAPQEKIWTVAATTVVIADYAPNLKLYGQLVAGRETELRALVVGPVIRTGENFVEGGTVKAGELLLAIDPFDYRAVLDERKAQLAEALARTTEITARRRSETQALKQDEKQLDLTMKDYERIKELQKKGTVSNKRFDDSRIAESRQNQLVSTRKNNIVALSAQLDQQKATTRRLEVGVRRAKRDLARTKLKAPFSGFLLKKNAELGKRLSLNDPIVKLVEADNMQARFHVSSGQYGRLVAGGGLKGRKAEVIWRAGDKVFKYAAVVDRAGASIQAASGGVDIYARLQGAGVDQPLRPGAFVEVTLKDFNYKQVIRVAETALHTDTVYVAKDGRLDPRKVEIIGRAGEEVLLRGALQKGEKIVVTRFAEMGPGMKIEVR
ncbi:MAG: efflux RND transporter periplasmic adaptor subunit [Alphaproteobacteria bacterium]|jgi:membrane fusion protein, multidrug efflux system|nr:efflux RND transporter periplasmic adaptor subunit [Alphaproteobacteria bacterium]MBT5162158.1 efflux RND transporter periplasmic adaptor subunit [Alphaproteobacteria bacterium]MBT5919555.1 efflux RND transporter periplasmic adaptor subunit [Alphaproteobacteria bacterium]MBT6385401.1 efflux RND transporter periplasmic adaptor subunit [Alphaproteobacteria bacterium]